MILFAHTHPTQSKMSESPTTPILQPLKGHNAFDVIFRHGARFAYRGVTAFIVFREILTPELLAAEPALMRLVDAKKECRHTLVIGVSSKRRTRPAAVRNRIKRLLRASVHEVVQHERVSCDGVAAMVLICNIIPEKPSMLGLGDVLPLVRRIFQNADKYYRSHISRSQANRSQANRSQANRSQASHKPHNEPLPNPPSFSARP
jgi:ribonuclease P protein component